MLSRPAAPPPPAARRVARERRASHALLLLVLASLLLLGGAAVRQAATAPELAAAPSEVAAAHPAAAAAARPAGGPAADPISTWVQTIRDTTLWSGPDGGAAPLTRLGPATYLQVTGAVQATRVPIRYQGGSAVGSIDAWVNVADVSGSAAPADAHAILAAVPASPPALPTAAPTAPPVLAPHKVTDAEPPDISAVYAVVVDEASGGILYGRNPHGQVAPASLTKIVTAEVTLERVASLDEQVTVDVDSRVMYDSTIMGLTPGDTVSVRALLYGLMLPSGNDAALALGRHVAGSDAGFVALMNQEVAELGLQNSHFMNPHGLDADGHYSSPYDMVMLARAGMRDGHFQALSAARSWQGEGFAFTNLNRMLWLYPGADGVKVGFTDNAGRSIVASATVDGHRVYVGMMRAPDMLNDCAALFNYVFNNYEWTQQPARLID
jgi:D-alanyl-D-alanine carboxypeptidase